MRGDLRRLAACALASGGRPPFSFSGLPGDTSHQIWSSAEPAQREQARLAVPLMRRIEGAAEKPDPLPGAVRRQAGEDAGSGTARRSQSSRPGLARAVHAVFEARQLLDADRAARVHPAGGDADLGAHAELAAVGELGGGVVQHDRRNRPPP